MLFLIQDGITNGAIYALLGLALVLVFAVTRVILIPQGEFVTYGALTYATLSAGNVPGTVRLAVAMGAVAFCLDLFAARKALHARLVGRAFAVNILLPVGISFYTFTQIAFLVDAFRAMSRDTRCRITPCSSPIFRT